MTAQSIWLIGAGSMAQDYARVLQSLKQPFEIIGRGQHSAIAFKKATGLDVRTGGLRANLKIDQSPETAIVAVGVQQLANITEDLINSGTKKILLEKPGSINLKEINSLNHLANKKKVEVYLAYNRRFYSSVEQLRKLITEDGGLLSANFDFTEWAHVIKNEQQSPEVKEHWLIGNSSHVIDLAFHLCGKPKDWNSWCKGNLDWHPASARFCGAGVTNRGVLFSYLSDWQGPGRWGLELITSKNRFILRPLEKLQVVRLKSVLVESIELDNKLDESFKPGLYKQTNNFLKKDYSLFCSLSEQVENIKIYSKIAGYLQDNTI